jgi:predicted extracellular nuclease
MALHFRRLALASAFLFVLAAWPVPAQGQPTELFFSEYIEGSSNNKALEIYNGTGAAVNLAGYSVHMYFNGSMSAGLNISLTGTVAAGDVFVLAQSAADAAIIAEADQTNGAGWFNGDDAVVLRKAGVIIDVIGQIGFDPGTEWGTGLASTADNTLRRKSGITAGDTNGSNAFNPAVEWDGFATNTFDGLGGVTPPPPPEPELHEIFEIQGPGLASPFAGIAVRTEDNVVTAVTSNGFFMQMPDARADADPETSNGIFVFTGSAPTVTVGDEVTVTGTVSEFFNLTEITAPTVTHIASGVPLPATVAFNASLPSPNQPQPATELERYEGMLVRVVGGTVTGPSDRFGDFSLVAGPSRTFREPGIMYPGFPGRPDLPVWDGNPEVFEIDPNGADLPGLLVASGAHVTAEGPLTFAFSDYQIFPTSMTVTGSEPAVVPVRARADAEFTVGSQNMLRLFDTTKDPDLPNDEPVLTQDEYENRLSKLSAQVRLALGAPDIVAVQEVENLGALQDLAARIHSDDSTLVYTAYLLEGNDIGGIDSGFLVRDTVHVDSVEQFGKDDLFTFGTSTTLLNDRPPLVLRGSYTGNGAPFPITVIDVHQRSLSGIDGTGSDASRIRAKRHEQALRLSRYIQELQSAGPNVRLVVIGDFNAFEFTDGYVDVMGQVTGNPDPAGALLPATDEVEPNLTNQTLNMPAFERYSFVFDGTAQSLDHALTSSALDRWVRAAQHTRGNADTPAAYDLVADTALRSSDHDGTVLFVMSDFDADAVPDDQDNCRLDANSDQADTDGDHIGNACDADDDNDGLPDVADNCPLLSSPDQRDTDQDGIGDACDPFTGPPTNKDQCKDGGWLRFDTPAFRNQGLCVSYVERNENGRR